MSLSLTSHLLETAQDAYVRATQHSFLKAAGDKSISVDRLELWLTQDRIYAFVGYPKFISILASRLPLRANRVDISNTAPPLEERILGLLSSSLSNIVREIEFFRQTAFNNGLDIMKAPGNAVSPDSDLTGPITKAYTNFMISTAATGNLLDGLVLLWATEKCYLEAWTYARSHTTPSRSHSSQGASRALDAFIANWTSEGFRAFVNQIGMLLDEYAATLSQTEFEESKKRAEEVWRWTLWYEERFWDGE